MWLAVLTVALPPVSPQVKARLTHTEEGAWGVDTAMGTVGMARGTLIHICNGNSKQVNSGTYTTIVDYVFYFDKYVIWSPPVSLQIHKWWLLTQHSSTHTFIHTCT